MYSLSSLAGPADCVSCILLFIISVENEISFETLSAISSFQIEPHHVVFLVGRRLERLITDLLVQTYVTKDTRTGVWRLKDNIRGVSLPKLKIQGEKSKLRPLQYFQEFFFIITEAWKKSTLVLLCHKLQWFRSYSYKNLLVIIICYTF